MPLTGEDQIMVNLVRDQQKVMALTERGLGLFGEVAQARFTSLAQAMRATTRVTDARG